MRCVLLPIDGSHGALRALAHAVGELQGRTGTQLHVLNVQLPYVHSWPDKLVSPDMIERELRRNGDQLLEPALAMAHAAGLDVHSEVRIGQPAEEIAAAAVEHGCDAIVMGTRGMGAVSSLVFGSIAHKVLHLASVPVTFVK